MKRVRVAFAIVISVLVVSIGGSCTSVLSLDGYASASDQLCDLLDQCYADGTIADCRSHIESGLTGSDSGARAAWLASFSDLACLDTCVSAEHCLDIPPVCLQGPCTRKEDCCGFVRGRSDCSATGVCCRPRGIGCNRDADCCEGAGDCNPETHTCGGTVCVAGGQHCLVSAECCTGICSNAACSDFICVEDGFECTTDKDCCNGSCDAARGKCGVPACGNLGFGCQGAGDPACCNGLVCFIAMPGLPGVCSTDQCAPVDEDCATDNQCCSGRCDPVYFVCSAQCTDAGGACSKDNTCCSGTCTDGKCEKQCSNTSCTTGGDCCSGTCSKGFCTPVCITDGCGHGECSTGGPLDPKTCTGVFLGDNVDPACVTQVCQSDPFCCCSAWDSLCVSEALTNPACPNACD